MVEMITKSSDTILLLRSALASLGVICAYLLCSMTLLICYHKASFVGGTLLIERPFLIVKKYQRQPLAFQY